MPTTSTKDAPIMENENVVELLSILRDNNRSDKALLAVLGQVTAMEKQLAAAVRELAAMRRDLAEAEKRNHPIKNALQKAVIAMQAQVIEMRNKLAQLKQSVIDGCKNAVQAFKDKGITALDNITRFFKIRPMLESIQNTADRAAQSADKTIANIEAISAQYHEAGKHLKNAGRALSGKEIIQEAKPNGKVSKTFSAPFRAVRACFAGIRNHAVVAVSKLKQLEEQAATRKPSIKKDIEKYTEKIEREGRDAPNRARSKPSPEH